jgi:hypothetical protein
MRSALQEYAAAHGHAGKLALWDVTFWAEVAGADLVM